MSAEPLRLSLFSQSSFPAPVSPELLASSPTLNLAATVTNANTLSVRRAQGELVSSSTERGLAIQALCWKADGQFLAVACDDGTVRIVGVENAKVVHRIRVSQHTADSDADPEPITYIAWAQNLTGRRHFGRDNDIASRLKSLGLSSPADGFDLGGADGKRNELADLPHALTFLEIDSSLPKISPLPVSGGTGHDMFVFSTTASLESMFAPLKPQDNDVVDVTVVGSRDGSLHLSIYDSFPIGNFKVPIKQGSSPSSSQMAGDFQLCLHSSHPEVSTHSLLLRTAGEEKVNFMYLVPMDLRFVSYSPVNLSLLASKTTTLQKLLRYVKQTQIHIINEWSSTRELPSRFLSFIQEDLQQLSSGPTSIVQAFYHTVLTGHVHRPVREWLVDSVAERGHKRWEKAVIPGLENLRDLIHQNMLPAIERCALILSRLSGIARFHEEEDQIGFTNAEITRLVDILSAFNLVCNKVLLIVMEELELFRMFSSWLRITIDRVSSSTVSDEIMEKEALLDPSKILLYIENYLVTSPMAIYLAKVPQEAWDEGWGRIQESSAVLEDLDEQLKLEQAGRPFIKALPQMAFLVDFLTKKAGNVFKNIAEAEKRSVRFGQAVRLEVALGGSAPETFASVDMKMCSVPKPNGMDGITYTAVISEGDPCNVGIFETKIEIINGISSAPSTAFYSGARLDPQTDCRFVDIKFLNEEVLLALCHSGGKQPHLLRILFRPQIPRYQPTESGIASLSHEAPPSSVQRLDFPEDRASFIPVKMEVMEANDTRGGVPARVCLLGGDGVSYKVFALPERGEQMVAA
ncbi:Anaphase-promoting complex subunit 4 [Cytospora mali]|uniref:Anaphase-promoting complex subunit 4 n=1 Tax=Cytospora mali TaxID=578113 RepID=A0A194VIU9_CYTMA|nr:Anaphase-promoting complex subunit 4 [Valsa mali]